LLSGLIFGGGTFVAVGEGGVILTSRDTVRWKGKKSPSAGFHDAVGYGQGGFVIVGEDILTSSDGTLWRPRAPSERLGLSAITWGRNKFVAISGRGGMTWGECMERVPLGLPGHCYFEAVTFGAGIFVAVGWHGADADIATSEDGINWRQSLSSNLVMPMPPHPVSLF
jgi:hypothetical protein